MAAPPHTPVSLCPDSRFPVLRTGGFTASVYPKNTIITRKPGYGYLRNHTGFYRKTNVWFKQSLLELDLARSDITYKKAQAKYANLILSTTALWEKYTDWISHWAKITTEPLTTDIMTILFHRMVAPHSSVFWLSFCWQSYTSSPGKADHREGSCVTWNIAVKIPHFQWFSVTILQNLHINIFPKNFV